MIREGELYFGIKDRTSEYRFETKHYDIAQLILVTRGSLELKAGPGGVLRPGEFCLLFPGSSFRLAAGESGYRGIAFEDWAFPQDEYQHEASPHTGDSRMQLIGEWIEEEHRRPGGIDTGVVKDLCRTLFSMALRIKVQSTTVHSDSNEPYLVGRARELLEARALFGQGVQQDLATLPISYRHLARHFLCCTGKSPKLYQEEYRMGIAAEYLRRTEMKIEAVARELGFASSQHFSQTFRRIMKISPGEYRRQHHL